MSIYSMFGTDKALEERGVWLELDGEVSFLIARIGHTGCAYNRLIRAKFKPHRRRIENDTLDDEVVRKIQAEVFAKTALLDWKGVTDKDGNKLPFSKEKAEELLLELPELADILFNFARDYVNYRQEEMEDEAKN